MEKRLRLGHGSIFSNEIDVAKTPLSGFEPGAIALVSDAGGKPVGLAYVNPNALICARLLTRDVHASIDVSWFVRMLRRAVAMRDRIYEAPFYRAVYGDADGLPGIIVDRFGDVLVVQLNTAGAEALETSIVPALHEVFAPAAIRVTSAHSMREVEGLKLVDRIHGELPAHVVIPEGGAEFLAPLEGGQKTGWFYDQRENRLAAARFASGARVLDTFAYVGAWSIHAARAGAREVVTVDRSEFALDVARRNAERSGVAIETIAGDALETMQRLAGDGRRFDLAIVDPPALIKRRKDREGGIALYERINVAALELLAPDALLVSCSCSFHMEEESLRRALLGAAKKTGRRIQLIARYGQGFDHPVHPAMPETNYLKGYLARVT